MTEYIERDALLDDISAAVKHRGMGQIIGQTLMRYVKRQPVADVAPVVHGRIVGSLDDGRYRRRFSCCGEDATMITQWAWPNYCPNCGAKMDGGDNDEAD